MAFRSPENVQRNELIRFQLQDNIRAPANGQEQLKKTYKFVVTDKSSFYDWYNAFFMKCNLNYISKLMEEILLMLLQPLSMDHIP